MLFEWHSYQPVVFLFVSLVASLLIFFPSFIFYKLLLQQLPTIFYKLSCRFSSILHRSSSFSITLLHLCGIPSSPACRANDQFSRDQLTILLPAGPGGKRQVSARSVKNIKPDHPGRKMVPEHIFNMWHSGLVIVLTNVMVSWYLVKIYT